MILAASDKASELGGGIGLAVVVAIILLIASGKKEK